jgi:transcriptional regulator with XRE-family HTH domain
MTLSQRLRDLMNERNPPLTQEALAERIGVTHQAVGRWLKGAIPYPSTLNKICLALGVRRDWLLYGEGKKELPDIGSIQELPRDYSRREKITFIEEQAPELLPLVDSFLESVRRQIGDERASKPKRRTRESSR